MKLFFAIHLLLITAFSYAQKDHGGNPVFNSIQTGEDTLVDYHLTPNYYTLKNNIENKLTAVYIAENPTLDQILNAAVKLPSNFFVIVKGHNIIRFILVNNYPEKYFLVVDPKSNSGHWSQTTFCSL